MSDLTKIYASQEYVDSKIPEPIGWSTEGESYYVDGENYTGQEGAIVLNKETNKAIGKHSVAEGYYTTAIGDYSHAEGYDTTAIESYSHAEGIRTKASWGSHAEGTDTETRGYNSHAEGGYTLAAGSYSHAEGFQTIVNKSYQHVQGKFNVIDNNSSHIVGNGTYDARSNAHTLDWNGNAWFAGDVYTGSTSGTNKDAGSKKLATEDYVNESLSEVGGGSQVYIQESEPTDAQEGDIWVDPNSGTSSTVYGQPATDLQYGVVKLLPLPVRADENTGEFIMPNGELVTPGDLKGYAASALAICALHEICSLEFKDVENQISAMYKAIVNLRNRLNELVDYDTEVF